MGNSQNKVVVDKEQQVSLPPFDFNKIFLSRYDKKYSSDIINTCIIYANKGNADAYFALGIIYSDYCWNIRRSFHYMYMAAQNENKNAHLYLGIMYFFGNANVSNNKSFFKNDIVHWSNYEGQGWESEDKLHKLESDPDYKKSFQSFILAEAHLNENRNGNGNGTNGMLYAFIGKQYALGLGVDQSDKKALENYEKAYVLGYVTVIDDIYKLFEKQKDLGADISTDDHLYWLLTAKSYHIDGSNIFIAKIYEARKNYALAISYCEAEVNNVVSKKKNRLEEYKKCKDMLTDLRAKQKEAIIEEKSILGKVDELENQVRDLKKQIEVMGTSVVGIPSVSTPLPLPIVTPPPYE